MKSANPFNMFVLTAMLLSGFSAMTLSAGQLNPPAAPTAGTMKTLDEVEPRIAINATNTPGDSTAQYIISQAGSYYLTGNISISFKHGILINANDVTVDLMGYRIYSSWITPSGTLDFDGIYVTAGRRNTHIRNGSIQSNRPSGMLIYKGFRNGILAGNDTEGIVVTDIRISNARQYGIYLGGNGHRVTDCTVVNCTGPGIHAGYPSTVKDNHQSGNGDDMLPVKAGAFAYQDALSTTTWVNVPDFFIAKYETTNTEYCRFLNEMDSEGQYHDSQMEITQSGIPGQYTYTVQSGKESHPIRYASFYEAQAYANWKSRVTGLPYRLPTEEEWEKAAGWDPEQRKLWTYGFQQHTINDTWCNYDYAYGGPLPVGTFNGTDGKNDAFSYYGCYDMTGNVWEWTSSVQSTSRVVRGGGYFNSDTACTVTYRSGGSPAGRPYGVGFRLVRDFE